MAEEMKNETVVEPEKTAPETEAKEEQEDKQPTQQELLVQIAKLKRATDKATAEAAEFKRKWKSVVSEQEAADIEKAEIEAKKEERLKELERNEKIHSLMENYMDLKYTKEQAKKAAEAMVDGEMETVFKVQQEVEEAKLKAKEAEWLASRPEPASGTDGKEDPFIAGFDSVPMRFGS